MLKYIHLSVIMWFIATQAAYPVITAKQNGPWNCGSTWDSGSIPEHSDDVLIPTGIKVSLDQPEAANAKELNLEGTLDQKTVLKMSGNFNNRQGGVHNQVENAKLYFDVEDDTLMVGGDSGAIYNSMSGMIPKYPARGDVGYWCEGEYNGEGKPKTPYVDLLVNEYKPHVFSIQRASAVFSFSTDVVSGTSSELRPKVMPSGWEMGDAVVTCSPDGQAILGTLTGVSETAVYVSKVGEPYAYKANGIERFPKLINLTRSAGIYGGPGHRKSHFIVIGSGRAIARNVEFVDLGPEGKLGRYGFHLHHAMFASIVDNCSFYGSVEPINRSIAIHNTGNHFVTNNVMWNVRGRAVFMEDPKGKEIGNKVTGNISMNVNGDASGNEVVSTPESATYNATAHYWVRPGNQIENNIAVGGTAVGLVVMPGISKDPPTITSCQTWGVGRYGFQTGCQKTAFNNTTAINSDVAGFGSLAKFGFSDLDTKISNAFYILNGEKPDSPFLTSTDLAYICQVYMNSSPQLYIDGGTFIGQKGWHTHYSVNALFTKPFFDVNIMCTPTYYESDVIVDGGQIKTGFTIENQKPTTKKIFADSPYPLGITNHGRIVMKGVQFNGVDTTKTYTHKSIAQTAKLAVLNTTPLYDSIGRETAVEVTNDIKAGYFTLPDPNAKRVRMWPVGDPKPANGSSGKPITIGYRPSANFNPNNIWDGFGGKGGMYPGKYVVEGYTDPPYPGTPVYLNTWEVEIKPGVITAAK